jgi:hypothetical protein
MTRSVYEMTDPELLALTDDDIDRLIKRAMAEEGIPIVPIPSEPEYAAEPQDTVHVYEIAGLYFTEHDAAVRVMDAINKETPVRVKPSYDYTVGYNPKTIEHDETALSITTQSYLTPQAYDQHRDTLTSNNALRKQHEKEKQAYQDAERRARGIVDHIRETITAAEERKYRREWLRQVFAEYKEIANGDPLMAITFFRKAHQLDDDELVWLQREFSIEVESAEEVTQ